jgi:hypothetical protein
MKMETHYLFEGICKLVAGVPPVTDLLQSQNGRAAEFRGVKILMSDRVSPSIQFLKPVLPGLIAHVQVFHLVPERKPKSIIVFPNISGVGITCLQLPVLNQNVSKGGSQNPGRDALDEVVGTFGVQIATVTLKL